MAEMAADAKTRAAWLFGNSVVTPGLSSPAHRLARRRRGLILLVHILGLILRRSLFNAFDLFT